MPVFQYQLTDKPGVWLTVISTGDDIDKAVEELGRIFGPGRIIDVRRMAEDRRDDDD
jgi:hypothetical protein